MRLIKFAFSNCATGMYEAEAAPQDYAADDPRVIDQTIEVWPDSPYGEALGTRGQPDYDAPCAAAGDTGVVIEYGPWALAGRGE